MRAIDRTAIVSFLVSRGLLFVLLILGSQLSFVGKVDSGTVWETRITLQQERLLPELIRIAMPGDSWWYRSIAMAGYGPRADAGGAPNYAFFPLYPLLVRYAGITGDFTLDGLLLSNIAFALALLLLGRVALRSGLGEEQAERAVIYLAFFPTSYFCSMPLTESLCLALFLGAMLAAHAGKWPLAALLGALAALTRLPGVLILVPLAIVFHRKEARGYARALWLLLVPAGSLAFVVYLRQLTGDWRAFLVVQEGWGRKPGWFWTPLLEYLAQPAAASEPWNFTLLNFAFALLLGAAAFGLLRRKQWALAAFTLVSLLLPLSTGSLQSLGRYALVVFPLFLWLALFTRRPSVDRVVLAVLVTLFGWLTAMFILRVDFALA